LSFLRGRHRLGESFVWLGPVRRKVRKAGRRVPRSHRRIGGDWRGRRSQDPEAGRSRVVIACRRSA